MVVRTSGKLTDMTSALTPRTVRVRDAADLIAAVPTLLGFVPERSVVLVGVDTERAGPVIRHDIVLAGDTAGAEQARAVMRAILEQCAAVCARERAGAVAAVVVDDRAGTGRAPFRRLAAELHTCLTAHGIRLVGAHAAPALAAGGQWWSLGTDGATGVLPDPFSSPLAVAAIAEGRVVHRSRRALADILACRNPAERDRVEALLAATDRAVRPDRTPVSAGAHRLRRLLAQLTGAGGQRLSAAEVAELALALTDTRVRDAALALVLTVHAAAAEALWLQLVRVLPAPERAEAAMLYGFFAYVRGDGAIAAVAADAALQADPGHVMANHLDVAVRAGLSPDVLVEVARSGYDAAAGLGVALPPAVLP